VDFNTLGADFFVPGLNCRENCAGHKLFDPSASSTVVDLDKTFEIGYPDGSNFTRVFYNETVHVSGIPAVSETIGVAIAYPSSRAIDEFPPDGSLGLAFQFIAYNEAPPVLQTMYDHGQLDQPVFALKLAKNGSELSIGGVNPALYTGSITYTPVTTPVSRTLLILSNFSYILLT
jgi:cathepsin D